MRTHLEFRAPEFADPEGTGNSFNPDIQGRRLSQFLSDEFRTLGYDGNIIEEDWGWMVELGSDPFPLWLGCASYGDPDGWLVFIEPSKPQVRRWFRKFDTREAVAEVGEKFEKILVTRTGATDLQWWSYKDLGRR